MSRWVAVVFLCLLYITVNRTFAQRYVLDSLHRQLKAFSVENERKVDVLTQLSFNYNSISPDSSVYYAAHAYDLAVRLRYRKGQADALKNQAIGVFLRGELQQAIRNNELAYSIYKDEHDKKGEAAVLNNLAMIHHNSGEYRIASGYYKRSLFLRRQLNDMKSVADSYNNIGNLNLDLGNYAESLEYLLKALVLRERLNDEPAIANSYGNLAGLYLLLSRFNESRRYAKQALALDERHGNLDGAYQACVILGNGYYLKKDIDSSMYWYRRGLALARKMKNDNAISVCYLNLGKQLVELGQYVQAENYLKQSLKLSEMYNDKESIGLAVAAIGSIRMKQHQLKEAIRYFKQSMALAKENGNKDQLYQSSGLLADAYAKTGDNKNELINLRINLQYKDSLHNRETERRLRKAEINYIENKKQFEIDMLLKNAEVHQAKLEREQLLTSALIAGLVLTIVVIGLMINMIKNERRLNANISAKNDQIAAQAKKLEELNALKDKLFSVLAHDLRSPVASLTTTLDLLEQKILTEEEFTKLVPGLGRQVKSLDQMLDNLLLWAKSHLNNGMQPSPMQIDINNKVQEVIDAVQEIANNKNIQIATSYESSSLLNADPDHVTIILRNILSNAIKYCHTNGNIEITTARSGDRVRITISDDGVGMSDEKLRSLFRYDTMESASGTKGEKGTGIGLLLCKEFIELNGGNILVNSVFGKGSRVILEFRAV